MISRVTRPGRLGSMSGACLRTTVLIDAPCSAWTITTSRSLSQRLRELRKNSRRDPRRATCTISAIAAVLYDGQASALNAGGDRRLLVRHDPVPGGSAAPCQGPAMKSLRLGEGRNSNGGEDSAISSPPGA